MVNTSILSEEEKSLLSEYIDEKTGEIIYPESDGKPIAENTIHFQWITTIQGGLDSLFAEQADVFVAGDLLWYPVEGKPYLCVAPDIMVAFGRPKGQRGSYEQWKEDNVTPQVVVEILSKGNTVAEMNDKFIFYQNYGVKEYYVYDFRRNKFYASLREKEALVTQEVQHEFVSPLLGIRFDISKEELQLFNPDGTAFLTYVEQDQQRKKAIQQKEKEKALKEEAIRKESEERKLKEEAIKKEIEERQLKEEAIGEEQKAIAEKENALQEIARLKALLNKNE